MRLAALYLRSRRAGRAALTLLAVAPVAWALTWLLVSQTPYGVGRGGLTLLLVFGSLAVACVVGASAGSPFDEAERVTARPLSPLRLGHLVGLLLCSAFFLSVALLAFDLEGARPAYPLLVLLRNLAGLVGLALLAAGVAGARLSWVPPFALALAYPTLAGSKQRRPLLLGHGLASRPARTLLGRRPCIAHRRSCCGLPLRGAGTGGRDRMSGRTLVQPPVEEPVDCMADRKNTRETHGAPRKIARCS